VLIRHAWPWESVGRHLVGLTLIYGYELFYVLSKLRIKKIVGYYRKQCYKYPSPTRSYTDSKLFCIGCPVTPHEI